MNDKRVRIKYGNFAPEAKENFEPSASESQFNTLPQLKEYGLNFPNYANPCESYQVALDGAAVAVPSVTENANLGLWSESLTTTDGEFEEPIVLALTSNGQYSSQGITLTFDTYNNIYPTFLNIKWYRDDVVLSDMDFLPDSAQYSCYNQVEFYNKVVITFYNLNMPLNRLKLTSVDYGYGAWFEADHLRNVKLIQEINPISTEISINTVDFVLDIKTDKEFLFQKKQPLEIYFNGELKATTFVRNFKRKSKNLWDIQTDDYIGLLDGVYFYGGLYSSKKAVDILAEIFEVAKVPYVVDDIFEDELVTGYIPYTTCRQALMQVAFAIQAAVDTSNSDIVKIFALDNTTSQSVPLSRIMQGQSFQDEESITGVELTAHAYTPISNIVKVYDAKESGIGENVFVKFSEPLHDLSITNGEIVDFGTNYAVINADSGCQLNGQKYDHATRTKRKNNPLVLANDIPKIVAIENATLISASNIDKVLEKCYNYLVITNQVNLDIVENKNNDPVNVGDLINVETEYSGDVNGRVIKQSFNLNGGIIIKKTTMRGTI